MSIYADVYKLILIAPTIKKSTTPYQLSFFMSQFRLLSQKQSENLAQMVEHLFAKVAQVVVVGPRVAGPVDRWFNLELRDTIGDDLSLWRAKDILVVPPMVLETVLDLHSLSSRQALVFNNGGIVKTERKSEIVLERWLVELDLTKFDNESVELPTIYRKLIILFRSLYMLIGMLPTRAFSVGDLAVETRVLDGSKTISSRGRIGLSKPLGTSQGHVKSHKLSPVLTPIGALKVSVSYRSECDFALKDKEPASTITENIGSTSLTARSIDSASPSINNVFGETPPKQRTFSSGSPRRRSSLRSVPLFKVASIASTTSPPSSQVSQSPALGGSVSSFAASKPIPVTINRTGSTASLAIKHSSPSSVPSSIQITSSTGSKFVSSFGSKFRSSSRNSTRTLTEGQPDDDLDGFFKLLDSKPDLRVTSGSGSYDLKAFKQFQQTNDLLVEGPPSRRRSSSNSPSFHVGSSTATPVGPTVTPAVSYANKFLVGKPDRPRTSSGSSVRSQRMIESLKQRSYSEQVFDSDDEEKKPNSGGSAGTRKPTNLHQLAMYQRQGSHEDEDDELLFAMSDMTLAKNSSGSGTTGDSI